MTVETLVVSNAGVDGSVAYNDGVLGVGSMTKLMTVVLPLCILTLVQAKLTNL